MNDNNSIIKYGSNSSATLGLLTRTNSTQGFIHEPLVTPLVTRDTVMQAAEIIKSAAPNQYIKLLNAVRQTNPVIKHALPVLSQLSRYSPEQVADKVNKAVSNPITLRKIRKAMFSKKDVSSKVKVIMTTIGLPISQSVSVEKVISSVGTGNPTDPSSKAEIEDIRKFVTKGGHWGVRVRPFLKAKAAGKVVAIDTLNDGNFSVTYRYHSGKTRTEKVKTPYFAVNKAFAEGDKIAAGWYDFHEGVDFSSKMNEGVVVSPVNGIVFDTGYQKDRGNYAVLATPVGLQYHFYHLASAPKLVKGNMISQNDFVGMIGATGRFISGPHLHFAVVAGPGQYLDPFAITAQDDPDFNIKFLNPKNRTA